MKQILILTALIFTTSVVAQDSIRRGRKDGRLIRSFERSMVINGSTSEVFAFMDDIRNTGKHMTQSSGAMAGSKLQIQWLSENKTGLGTRYRWTGKVMGMKMDFTVEVSSWASGKQKVWGTVGKADMIVIDWFEMYLMTNGTADEKTDVRLGIYYTKHKSFNGFLFGKMYAKWCVKSMLKDTRKHFKTHQAQVKELAEVK